MENRKRSILGKHLDHLARTARNTDLYIIGHMLALQIKRHGANIAVGAIRARANHNLINLLALERLYRHDIARAMGSCHKRLHL